MACTALPVVLWLTCTASAALGQIDPGGVVNAASMRLAGLPDSGITPGAIFTIYSFQAANIGPAVPLQAQAHPLPLALGGVSVQVTIGGNTVVCPLHYASSRQVMALLPSNAGLGRGELRLSFGGRVFSEPVSAQLGAFGVFAQNGAGTGAGAVQNFSPGSGVTLNTPLQSIHAGNAAVLWGTGLGPVPGNPAEACPFPCEVNADVRILTGGVPVIRILYAGRSPQFAGLDQINFVVPPGVSGCWVPVVVVVNGIPSNYTTISIAESGSVCEEPDGFDAQELRQFAADGQLRLGALTVRRQTLRLDGGSRPELILDLATGGFRSHPAQTFHLAMPPLEFLPSGSCWVYSFRNGTADFEEPVPGLALDAGSQLTVRGPLATLPVPRVGNGRYSAVLFSNEGPPIPGSGPNSFVEPGSHVLTGTGGADIGAFEARTQMGRPLTWTGAAGIRDVVKSAGLTVTWSGGDPQNEWVSIFGSSIIGGSFSRFGAAFYCRAPVAAGSFTIGPEVLKLLPATDPEGFNGTLRVGNMSRPARFTASGLDRGWYTVQMMNQRGVNFR